MIARASCLILMAAGWLCLAGCTPEEKLYEVNGIATRSGKPLSGLLIHLGDPEGTTKAGGFTDAEGRFKLLQASGREGIGSGTYRVWVSLPHAAKEDADGNKLSKQKTERDVATVLRKYGNPGRSPIVVEVKEKQEIQVALD